MEQPYIVAYLTSCGLPEPVLEYRFHPERRWRFDIAWPDKKIAIEIQGGVWTHGKHSRGKGQINDMKKLNAAQAMGWKVFQVTPALFLKHYMIELLEPLFK
jgi:hypothetical protein